MVNHGFSDSEGATGSMVLGMVVVEAVRGFDCEGATAVD